MRGVHKQNSRNVHDRLVLLGRKVVNDKNIILQGIWAKARTLLSTDGAIASAPGQSPEARMVLSYSRKVPHMVTPRKGSDLAVTQVVQTGSHWDSALIPLL